MRAVDGRAVVERQLRGFDGNQQFDLIAVGKAAAAMTQGARRALGARARAALVITKDGHGDAALERDPGVTLIESAHPVPDERSLAAGEELLRRIGAPRGELLFLVSGGASSLVEALQPGVTLAELRALNERGLADGWDIVELNARRARLSRLKGGGVARLLGGRRALALFISDVPGDDVGLIGSGLLGRDAGRPDFIERTVIANVEAAVQAVVQAAAARGLRLETRARRFDGDASLVASQFLAALRATPTDGVVWGGESTVMLPVRHGRGGRNMHLALTAACALRASEPLTILAAGTDGSDGPTADAGAIVDAGTLARAELGGVEVERALREFDSAVALEASEDLVHTGPTGTNVGDILIGIKRGAGPVRDLAAARML